MGRVIHVANTPKFSRLTNPYIGAAFLVFGLALRRAFFFVPFAAFFLRPPFLVPFLAAFFLAARFFLATVTPP